MTENYYLIQKLLPLYFRNPKNREFFFNTISTHPDNMSIFFEKELYGWVKEDLYRQKANDANAVVPEDEKLWKYKPIKSIVTITDDDQWRVIFVVFGPDFVQSDLDSISVAIAFKENEDKSIEIKLFMLETGKDHNKQPAVYVCENQIFDEKHVNYGTMEFNDMFMKTFSDKVFSILSNNNLK